ncbi:MAG TPA: hypothetical protein ENH82_10940 [bacterium]|nr:hypothetical protein [bacterium]
MSDINKIPGIKRKDLQKCIKCGEGVANNKQMTFFIVEQKYMVLNIGAVQQRHGLEIYFGGGQAGAALAEVMGTDEDLAKELSNNKVFVCLDCSYNLTIFGIAEIATEQEKPVTKTS